MPDRIEPGSTVGRYEIVSSLSAGGMGELYHARDPELGRDLVVKLPHGAGYFIPKPSSDSSAKHAPRRPSIIRTS
jgi:serine/threonine protein kinase